MAVVINEFEIVAEPPPAAPQSAPSTAEAQTERPKVPAQEMERLLGYEAQRALRVWAH